MGFLLTILIFWAILSQALYPQSLFFGYLDDGAVAQKLYEGPWHTDEHETAGKPGQCSGIDVVTNWHNQEKDEHIQYGYNAVDLP